ncbi:MAG: hypothetical protein ACJA06_001036 [Halocynthiibacter sp.]|jgi:hypothetical protein
MTDSPLLSALPGFGPGVVIETSEGPIPVDWLRQGDRVLTRDSGFQPVIWAGRTRHDGTAPQIAGLPSTGETKSLPAPIRLFSGGFGKSCPEHDLILAPAHRILLRSPNIELHFGNSEVLASARDLAFEAEAYAEAAPLPADFAYYHVLLDGHQTMLAEGVWLESLFPDAATLAALGPKARGEIEALIGPELNSWVSTRMCLNAQECSILHPRSSVAARRMAA